MDFAKLPHNFSITGYVQPCEHRQLHDQTLACAKVAELAGVSLGVDAMTCARCMLYGAPNEEYVRGMASGVLKRLLDAAVMGFHKGPEYIASLADHALTLSKDGEVEQKLISLVGLARLGHEDVKALLKKHAYPEVHPIHSQLATAETFRRSSPIPSADVQPCCGKEKTATLWDQVKSAAATAAHVAGSMLGPKAVEDEQVRRKGICEMCPQLVKNGTGWWCGKPWPEQRIRDEKVDGCGCYIDLKIKGESEKCPQGKW